MSEAKYHNKELLQLVGNLSNNKCPHSGHE